jgi:hypothetical protein
MNLTKKIIAIITALTVFSMVGGPALAVTVEELQASINSLLTTLAGLQAQLALLQGTPTGTTGCTITSFDRNLSQGSSGADVKCLQIILNSATDTKVATTGVGSPGSETTYFGALTKAAVIKFQEKYAADVLTPLGLTTGTGYVGVKSRVKLNTLIGVTPPPGVVCGNGVCETGETYTNCPADCPVIPPAAGLSVALATDNPVAAAIVSDSDTTTTAGGAQALIPILKLNFTASSEGEAKVTTLKLKRGGISADSDIANIYLTDGSTVLAEMTSISSGVITFTNSAGLFTVSAGTTKAITVKMDLGRETSAGKTMNISLNAASDVTATASTINGTFPIAGNTMTTASVTDLGEIDVATQTTPASVNAGESNREIWQFKLTGTNQKLRVEKVVLEMIGTADVTAITNVKLTTGGTQYGSTIASIPSSKILTFDLSSSPIEIISGQVKYVSVLGDVVSGAGRNFYFAVRHSYDLLAYDTQYNCYLKPNQANSYTAVTGTTTATSINAATLTVSRSSLSPISKIAADALNAEVARFDFKATGEAVKVSTLTVGVDTDDNEGLDDVALYVDGSQIGTTSDVPNTTVALSQATPTLETDGVSYSFGNAFIIPAGTTKSLVVKANIKNCGEASFSDTDTLQIQLVLGVNNAIGQSSSTNISTSAVNGNTLTVSSGTVVVTKNLALNDGSSTYPTAVGGATNAKIASFVINAPAGEAVDVSQIVVGDEIDITTSSHDTSLADSLYNLKLMNGTTQIGSTVGTLTDVAGTDYTFTPSSAIRIVKGGQYVVDIYADVFQAQGVNDFTNINADSTDGPIECVSVTATGIDTGASAGDTDVTDIVLQDVYIATTGNLTITLAGSTSATQTLTTGSTDVKLADFKFETNNSEGITVSKIVVSDATDAAASLGGLTNVRLYDGTTQLGSATYSWTTTTPATGTTGYIAFDGLSWAVAKGASKTLTVKADISNWPAAASATYHTISIEDLYLSTGTESVEATGTSSSASITGAQLDFSANTDADVNAQIMRVYKGALNVAKAGSSPSGTGQIGQADQTVAVFTVTNTSPQDYEATITDIDIYPMSTNVNLTSGTARYVKVYVDAISTAGLVATDTYVYNDSAHFWTDLAGCASTDLSAGVGCTEGTFTAFTVSAGSSRTIYVTADTNEAATTDSFQVKLIAGSTVTNGMATVAGGITWSDGTTTSIYDVDTLPVNGGALTY